jgi:hypothetical protein
VINLADYTPPKGLKIPKTHFYAYNNLWSKKRFNHPYMVELHMHTKAIGDDRFKHFRNYIDLLWGERNKRKHFIWHPWAEITIEEACRNKTLAIGGCAGSGKSISVAPYGIGEWLTDPMNTIVIVVSTSVKAAKKRIWGYMGEFWNAALTEVPLPGKLQPTLSQIVPFDGKKILSERTGIFLVAGEKGSEKESSDKLMGFHAKKVILILDELPDLSQAIVNTAISNLSQNPYFQIIGLGNPNDYFDAFSSIAEPEQGWQNVGVDMDRWRTKGGGLFLHFDSIKSPNILAREVIYDFLPKQEEYEIAKEKMGENSLLFWRQWRGFWAPEGAEDAIYSQSEIVKYGANLSDVEWAVSPNAAKLLPIPQTRIQNIPYAPVNMAFLDLGMVNGGDECIAFFAKFGMDKNKQPKLLFTEYIALHENINDRYTPREVQIVQAYRRECEKRDVHPTCAGYDASGAGIPYQGFMTAIWSKDVIPLQFGGKPSDLPMSDTDKTPCSERYYNKVTEIWFSAKWLMRSGIIKGLGPEVIAEMTKRKYGTSEAGNLKLRVEKKEKMKARIGHSCDKSDALMGLCQIVRQKFRWNATNANQSTIGRPGNNWKNFVHKHDLPRKEFDTGYSGMKASLDFTV